MYVTIISVSQLTMCNVKVVVCCNEPTENDCLTHCSYPQNSVDVAMGW